MTNRLHIYFYLFFSIQTCFLANCFGQTSAHFEHINTENGLSQSDINSIYQDNKGFMWFATHDGLNKYDGYTFTVYTPDNDGNSINSNLIFTLTGDAKGNLWIGTTGNGLNYFEKSSEKFSHFKYQKNNPNSISSNHINKVYLDKKNRLWVGTLSGLNLLDLNRTKDSLKFQRFYLNKKLGLLTEKDINSITEIYEDSKNQLWVGGAYGLYKVFKNNTGSFYLKKTNSSIGLPLLSVRSIKEDIYGHLLIGTTEGLYSLNLNNPLAKVNLICPDFINDILTTRNEIWAGSTDGLLNFENSDKNKLPLLKNRFEYNPNNPFSLSKNIVKSLYQDKTGIIWIGTNGGGINKLDPNRKKFHIIKKTLEKQSLSYDKIRSIFEDSNGTLWIGTEGGGLNMLPKNKSYTNFKHFSRILKPFAIIEIKRKNKKILLIGAEDYPSLFEIDITNSSNLTENSIKPIPEIGHSVFSLLEDSHKNIWIGTYNGGVHRWFFDEATQDYVKKDVFVNQSNNSSSISNDIIRSIFEDKKGNIWFATSDGLSMLKPEEVIKKQPKFQVFRNIPFNKNSISHNYILSIYESKAGDLWIGTFGGGLNKYLPSSSSFQSYTVKQGLPNNVIKGILEDQSGNLWMSTNKGLTKFNPTTKVFKNYDINDGLQSNEFQELACFKKSNGEMLFGGINGINYFFPTEILDNTIQAENVITDFSISNKKIDIGEKFNGRVILSKAINETKELDLKYFENSFSFEFAALHYAAPNKNKFAYMLVGFDENWIYTDTNKRFATYTNLSSGNYIFKVKAANNDGVWNSVPTEINITVSPPFWLTKLAYFIYILLFLGALFFYRKFTIIKTTKKHQIELDSIQKQKDDELNRSKLEFFTNISHEFLTPLTLIKGPIKYLQKNGKDLNQEEIQQQYHFIQKNTVYLLRLVNQLLDFRKVNQGKMKLILRKSNIVHFIKEISEPFHFLAQKRQIQFDLNSSEKTIETWFDQEALEKIIINLLSNAFKFTPKQGKIAIEISQNEQNQVVIKVKDNGVGIVEDKLTTIFERFYTEAKNSSKMQKGIGIGLSYTKSLIELHQGKIEVYSKPNMETIFTITLPMNKSAYENIPEISCKDFSDIDFYTRSSEAESIAISFNDELLDQNFSKSKSKLPIVLIVDDNIDIRGFIKQALSKNYTIYEATDGEMGLELANKLMPSIILTDIVMPKMDGYELCKNLKSQKETSHIPVIMLTAKQAEESELEGRKIGADSFIRKPFDIEILELKIINILKQRDELRKRFTREINLQPKEITVTSMDEQFLQKAISIIEDNMMNTDFNVEMLVKEMGHSRSNLYYKFKELTGLPSNEFIRNIKLKRAVQLFDQSDYSVKEIMYMTGFSTPSYFAKCFRKQFGVKPSEYIGQNRLEKNFEEDTDLEDED